MKRNVSLEEISDGRLYNRNDMVKAGCGDCKGCSSCCSGMGNSVILDPYDLYRLTAEMGSSFEELMQGRIELNVVDGVILPNLSMSNDSETCSFLNEQGRCSIHAYRPGICRLFPLGRYYRSSDSVSREYYTERGTASGTKHSFQYFLQIHECPAPNKTKVKVEKWVDTPNLARYEQFVCEWHYFLEDMEKRIAEETDDTTIKNINLFLLKLFYIMPYQKEDFYGQFAARLAQAKEVLSAQ